MVLEAIPLNDPRRLREAFGCFPSGVTAVCSLVDGRPEGMAASSFTSISLDPPLVSLCVQNTSRTWPRLRAGARLGVSVLGEAHDLVCRSLSQRSGDRFAEVDWQLSDGCAVFIEGSTAWLDCSVQDEVPAGDHLIVVLAVHTAYADPGTAPLVFHGGRFRRLTAPQTAAHRRHGVSP